MKLQTSIPPRRDGTVRLLGKDGVTYELKPDAEGDLVCDVNNEATVAHVLETRADFFWPHDEADYEKAEKLVNQFTAAVPAGDDSDVDDDDEILDPQSDGGLPVESNTPPADPAPAKRGPKPGAKPGPKKRGPKSAE